MRLFGFDIIRCSKKDAQELAVFKATTNELYDRLVEYLSFIGGTLTDDYDVDGENTEAVVQQIFERTETVSKLMILYQQNKFSRPITAVSMMQYLDQFRQHAGNVQQLMLHYVITKSNIEQFDEDIDDDDDEYEDEMSPFVQNVHQDFDRVKKKYAKSRQHLLKILFADINKLISMIQYDQFLIIFGVDILRMYKAETKHRLHGKPDYVVKVYNKFLSNKNDGGKQS